jgi:histidinol-phosphate aminotransferase
MVAAALAGLDSTSLRTYPPATAAPLRSAIAARHGLDPDWVLITNGGDEALRLAITTFVEPGRPIGMAEPSYSLYPVLAAIHGSPIACIHLDDHWQPPRDFAHQLNEAGVELAFLVNPHAPSGTLVDANFVSQVANAFRGVLVLDEAYADFVDPALRYDGARLVRAFDNLLVLRSFSKGYSLAGLRLGYLIGKPSLIEPITTKTRDSYNVNHLSQVAGLAAYQDLDHARTTWENVRTERRRLRTALLELGLAAPASQANFLLAGVPPPHAAREIQLALKARGVLVRWFDAPRLDDKLRITVGTPAQNERLLELLRELLTS